MSQVISNYSQITRLSGFGFSAPGTSKLPTVNGEVAFDFPVNSRIRFNAKGSDGQVRHFTLPRYNFATNSLALGDVGDIFRDGTQGRACWNTVVIGAYAGNKFKHGNGNAICGNRSMQDIVDSAHNTGFGDSAWRFITSGTDNTAIGYVVGQEVLTGTHNVFAGSYTGAFANASSYNIMIGGYAGAQVDSDNTAPIGTYNVIAGYAGFRYGGGNHNVGAGLEVLFNCLGDNNIAFGQKAGTKITHVNAIRNIHIGHLAGGVTGFQKADCVNGIAIGYNTYNDIDNQVVLGNTSVTHTVLRGNVSGIGGINFSQDHTGTPPTNGAIYRSGTYLFITMDTNGIYFNSANNATNYFGVLPTGQIMMKPPASATPAANGQMTFEATSNTEIKVKLKGSDGTVRSASLALS